MKSYDEICKVLKKIEYTDYRRIESDFKPKINRLKNTDYSERKYLSIFRDRIFNLDEIGFYVRASTYILKKSVEIFKFNTLKELRNEIIEDDFENPSKSSISIYRKYKNPIFEKYEFEYLSEDELEIFKENFNQDSFKKGSYRYSYYSYEDSVKHYRDLISLIEEKESEYRSILNLKIDEYNKFKNLFEKDKEEDLVKFDDFISKYSLDNPQSIVDRAYFIRNFSLMANIFKKDFRTKYNTNQKTLIIELEIPDVNQLPRYKTERNVKSSIRSRFGNRNRVRGIIDDILDTEPKYKNIKLTNSEYINICEFISYSLVIRVIFEIAKYDELNAFKQITLTAWAKTINSSTGLEEISNKLSINVKTNEIKNINLEKINPKDCFYAFEGKDLTKKSKINYDSEDKKLLDYYEKGVVLEDLSKIFGQEVSVIKYRINKLTEEK